MEKIALKVPLEKGLTYWFNGKYFTDGRMLLSADFYILTNKEFADLYEKKTPFKCSFSTSTKKWEVITDKVELPDIDRTLNSILAMRKIKLTATEVAIFSQSVFDGTYAHMYVSADRKEQVFLNAHYDELLFMPLRFSLYALSGEKSPLVSRNAVMATVTVPHKEKMLEEVFVCCVMPVNRENTFLNMLFSELGEANAKRGKDSENTAASS